MRFLKKVLFFSFVAVLVSGAVLGADYSLPSGESDTLCGNMSDGNGDLYENVEINGTVYICDYDGSSGGVLNITATGSITVNGVINGTGAGFTGGRGAYDDGSTSYEHVRAAEDGNGVGAGLAGDYYQDCEDYAAPVTGGSGAGYGAAGESVSENGGAGPVSGGSEYGNRTAYEILRGSGGGGGEALVEQTDCQQSNPNEAYGGNGSAGGAGIGLIAEEVTVSGQILVNGENGGEGYGYVVNDGYSKGRAGGGGAGSGGTVLIDAGLVDISHSTLSASGGLGGAGENEDSYEANFGGDGSGGRLKVFYNILENESTGTDVSGSNSGTKYYISEAESGNSRPEISDVELEVSPYGIAIVGQIDDKGEFDIDSISRPSGSTLAELSNSSFRIEDVSAPFSHTVTVEDSFGESGSEYVRVRKADFEDRVAVDDKIQSEDKQYVETTLDFDSGVKLPTTIEAIEPSGIQAELVNESVFSDSSVYYENYVDSFEDEDFSEWNAAENVDRVQDNVFEGNYSLDVSSDFNRSINYTERGDEFSVWMYVDGSELDGSSANRYFRINSPKVEGSNPSVAFLQLYEDGVKTYTPDDGNSYACDSCLSEGWYKAEMEVSRGWDQSSSEYYPQVRFRMYNGNKSLIASDSKRFDDSNYNFSALEFDLDSSSETRFDNVDYFNTDPADYRWEWRVDNVESTVFDSIQHPEYPSSFDQQELETMKEIENTGVTGFGQLNVSAPAVAGSCVNCSSRNISIESGEAVNESYRSQVDVLEEQFSWTQDSDQSTPFFSEYTVLPTVAGDRAFVKANVSVDPIGSGFNYSFTDLTVDSVSGLGSGSDKMGCVGTGKQLNVSEGGVEVLFEDAVRCNGNGVKLSLAEVSTPHDRDSVVGKYVDHEMNLSAVNDLETGFAQVEVNSSGFLPELSSTGSGFVSNESLESGEKAFFVKEFSSVDAVLDSPDSCPDGWTRENMYCYDRDQEAGKDYYNYSYRYFVDVKNDLSESNPIRLDIDAENLSDSDSADALSASVNGSGDNVSVEKGSEFFEIVAGTEFGNSSLHEGRWVYELNYRSPIPQSEQGTIVIGEEENEEYEWSISVNGFENASRLSTAARPGDELSYGFELENKGDESVNLTVHCLSDQEVCDWFESIDDHYYLGVGENNSVKSFEFEGRIPSDVDRDRPYGFTLAVTDPLYNGSADVGIQAVDFSIGIDPFWGTVYNSIDKVFSIRQVGAPDQVLGLKFPDARPIPYPFVFVPVALGMGVSSGLRRMADFAGVDEYIILGWFDVIFWARVVSSFLVFFLALVFL